MSTVVLPCAAIYSRTGLLDRRAWRHLAVGGGIFHMGIAELGTAARDRAAACWFDVWRAGTLEDDYALGAIVLQFLSGEFPRTSARARKSVYKRVRCPDFLQAEIELLLDSKR